LGVTQHVGPSRGEWFFVQRDTGWQANVALTLLRGCALGHRAGLLRRAGYGGLGARDEAPRDRARDGPTGPVVTCAVHSSRESGARHHTKDRITLHAHRRSWGLFGIRAKKCHKT